uniref:Uncharacterized protein n=1 Tax=viral metagenome TaxID=1070528 RepID=A0A6H2A3T4_9ZZZZ
MNNNAKLLLIFLVISAAFNFYQANEVNALQSKANLVSAYYQSEIARLYDFHLDCIADLHEYYKGK